MLFSKSAPNAGVQILRNDITQSGQQAGIRMFGQTTTWRSTAIGSAVGVRRCNCRRV